MTTGSTRLSKSARREQLLDTAMAIVRAHGTDSLTLLSLAEAAGVSRPIVYDHFGTRPGLLIALYRRLDERHRAASEEALRDAPAVPREIARVLSAAYFACATDMPEWTAISAALKGNQEMEAIERKLLDGYTDLMATALRPYSGLTQEALRLRCVGALGAAEAIAAELNRGRATVAEAIAALTDLTVGSIDAEAQAGAGVATIS
ncbi:TetR/AcrR family transcriptional regulator [Sinosporangium siamense]|uniref:TetR family transcriptional regulator n=1 Tax=Sinosporangium siamense TaxID=1367973 RepID=A0A919RLM6_9ACTN|nr:TetR/AcrR family transcriptional regulator [Sinosporangium siamense]GII94224.1 TetR family transcriptional regulator [Sinosporangium siamense]